MAFNFLGRDRTTPTRVARDARDARTGITASALFRSAHAFLTRQAPLTSEQRNDLSGRSFAYVDSKGGEHLPIHDKTHAIRARGRFNQTYFESAAKARDAWAKILAAEKRFGIKSGGDDKMPTPKIRAASAAHDIGTFAFAIEAQREGGGAPEWITLIPAGEFKGFDGRGPYKLDQPEHVVAATQMMLATHMTAGMPLDFDHATDFAAPEGRPAPAAGWIKQVRAVNGAIQGRIEWTANGAAAVAAHEYRYVSPVFEYDDDGSVIRLLRAALTNNPNLNLPAFSSGDGPWPFHPEQFEKSGQDGWAVHEAKGAGSEIPRAAQNDRQQEDGEGDMAFTAAETRLIAMMAKKSMPLHETVRALSEALPNVHPHKILDMAKLAVNPEDPDTDGDVHDDGAMDAADGDDGFDAESAENPYDGETMEVMTARHAEELARCTSDDERAQCLARHAEETQAFERRRAAAASHRQGEGRRRAGNGRREVTTKLDAAVARHPMMIAAQKSINDLRGERAREKAERLVDAAIQSGKLIPAQREWALAYASAEMAGFQKFIGTQVAMKLDDKGSPIGIRQAPPAADDANSLTRTELAICAQTGCTPAEYLKRKTYNAARITGVHAQATMLRIEVGAAPTAAAAAQAAR